MTAYYNEIDPYAAQWLRNLIAAGHIAPGDVDERSIVDVGPADLAGYTQCHFFAGIGTWSAALRQAGWPDARPIWTGSCPCQPLSAAGKGLGTRDERHLWPDWFRLIRSCRPLTIFGEQVASKDGLAWLDIVCTDLENEGYPCWPIDLCAAGFGAPNIRQRLWFMAYPDGRHASTEGLQRSREQRQQPQDGRTVRVADSREGRRRKGVGHLRAQGGQSDIGGSGPPSLMADAGHDDGAARGSRREQQPAASKREGPGSDCPACRGFGWVLPNFGANFTVPCERCHATGRMAHADEGQRGRIADGEVRGPDRQASGRIEGDSQPQPSGLSCDEGGVGNADSAGLAFGSIDHDGRGTIRVEGPPAGAPDPVNGFWSDAEWIACTDGKARPVESGTFPLAHGLPLGMGRLGPELEGLARLAGLHSKSLARAKSYRIKSLRGYGNAINQETAAAFIAAAVEAMKPVTETTTPEAD